MTAAWGACPPEVNSAGFWLGPGASSFEAAAAELTALVSGIMTLLGGDEAVAAALAFAWPAPTGDTAILANVPHMLWQGSSAGLLAEAAAQIQATAAAFESLKAATPTPSEVEINQTTHVALNAANFLGMLTPLIVANRTQYFGDYWVRSASNKYSYAAASATGVQAIPPLPPPAQTAMPMGGDQSQGQQGASDPMQMMSQMMSMPMQMLGQVGGQFGQVAGMGQQFMSPLMSMSSMSGAGSAPAGALDGAAGGWAGAAPAAGGPVSASLAGGGGIGGGLSGASSALRGPVSWSSATVPGTAESPVTRLVGAQAAMSTTPAGIGGGGGGGAMMGPMAARAAAESNEPGDKAQSMALLSAAILYRAPASVPVVTGGAGAMFGREAI